MGFNFRSLLAPALGALGTATLGPMGGFAGGALGNMLAGKKKKKAPPAGAGQGIVPSTLDTQLSDAQGKLQGQAFGTDGITGLKGWDPSASYKEYMGGAKDGLKEAFSTGLSDLAGGAAGRGDRQRTGFFNLDVGDFGRGLARDYYRTTSSAALQTAGMTGDKYRSVAGIENQGTTNYLDLLSGNKDRQTAEENAKRERKSNRTNAILGGLGTLGGAAIGAWLGKK